MDYDLLPKHMQDGARKYVEEGIPPGSFLRAVLEDKLVRSFQQADDLNITRMQAWATWLYWECPAMAYGSEEKVNKWIDQGGLRNLDSNIDVEIDK